MELFHIEDRQYKMGTAVVYSLYLPSAVFELTLESKTIVCHLLIIPSCFD